MANNAVLQRIYLPEKSYKEQQLMIPDLTDINIYYDTLGNYIFIIISKLGLQIFQDITKVNIY